MAHLRCDFFSDVLQLSVSMTVILPQRTDGQIGMAGVATGIEAPVLYLLHGLSDDDTTWVRRTSIERYAASLGLAVVMPQVHRSYYLDDAHGNRYWTFLSEELPELVGEFFRVSDRREDTFVAGLSMGGYGAFRWALSQPGRFAAAASLSGVLDLASRQRADPVRFRRTLGDEPVAGTDHDLLWLLKRADPATLPKLFLCCGTDDSLYPDSLTFRDACGERKVPLATDFGSGDHEWGYWDQKIRDVLAWLPLARPTP